jgi:predicted permease
MSNIVLLFACLSLGILLHHSGKLPANAPETINGFIIHVSLPALILAHLHGVEARPGLLSVAVMPWILFAIGAVLFWWVGNAFGLPRPTTGALILLGGLGNTSFIGPPMIESYYGPQHLSTGILIDQLGTYLVLSTAGITVAYPYSNSVTSGQEIARRIARFPPLLATLVALALALIPVRYPDWLEPVLLRLGGTLALVSVGLQLDFATLRGNGGALAMGARLQARARSGDPRHPPCGTVPAGG